MDDWQPATIEDVNEMVARDLTACDAEQLAAFNKYRVEPFSAPMVRYGQTDSVVVVARNGDQVIYWEDVEGGFNVAPISPDGRVLEHWCNDAELPFALNAWIEGRGLHGRLGTCRPTKVSIPKSPPRIMPRTREEIRQERQKLKAEYGQLFDSVSALLLRHDPIGIAFDNENTDEYDPETGTILPRLRNCEAASDVLRVVHEEFVRWFDAGNAGPVERYADIASEVWRLWQSHR